ADAASSMRRASATLTAYLDLEAGLDRCASGRDLKAAVTRPRGKAGLAMQKALDAPLSDLRTQRDADVALVGLLPEVLKLSSAAQAAADDLGIQVALAVVPKDAKKPLGPLAPLPTPAPTPRATPRPAGTSQTTQTR